MQAPPPTPAGLTNLVELPDEPPVYIPGELNRDSVFELLAAEIAGQQRQFDQALNYYMSQAELTGDPVVAERATRIAQFLRDPEAVIKASSLWAAADPDNSEPVHIKADVLLHEQRFDEALPLLERVLREDSTEAVLLIGSQSNDLSPEIAVIYEQLLAKISAEQPRRLDLLLTRALLKRRSGDDAGALALLDQGLRVEPGQPDLTLQKVEILRQQNKPRTALAIVEQGLRRNPGHKQLSVQRAQLLIATDPGAAIRQIDLLTRNHGDDSQLQYYLALLLLENQQYNASRDLLNRLLEANPSNATLHLYLGIIDETQGRIEPALTHYQAVDSGPNQQQAVARMLNLLEGEAQRDRAERLVQAAIEREPEQRTGFTLMLAEWLHRQDATADAIALLDDALNSAPDDVDLLYTRALMVEPLDANQMLRDLERALQLDPDNGMIQNALGYSLTLYTQHYERAHSLIARALEQHPDDPAVIDSMGWVLHKLGRDQEALGFLRRAYELFQDPEVASHLIQVLHATGADEEARTLLQRGLAAEPGNADLLEAARVTGLNGSAQ